MHEFVVDHEVFGRTEPHHWNPMVIDRNTIVFEVFGTDIEAYETALAGTERILSYELPQFPGDSPFVVVDERLDVVGMRQMAAVARGDLIVVPPVVSDSGRTVSMTLVGTDEVLQSAVEQLLEGHDLEVVQVRECTGPGSASAGSSLPRWCEVVEAAVDCGYYRKPRTGVVADMVAWLGCSTSTTAEHL